MVPVSEFDGGSYGAETLQCAALLPSDPTKLKAIDCAADPDHLGVICQTPGYGTVSNGEARAIGCVRHCKVAIGVT